MSQLKTDRQEEIPPSQGTSAFCSLQASTEWMGPIRQESPRPHADTDPSGHLIQNRPPATPTVTFEQMSVPAPRPGPVMLA